METQHNRAVYKFVRAEVTIATTVPFLFHQFLLFYLFLLEMDYFISFLFFFFVPPFLSGCSFPFKPHKKTLSTISVNDRGEMKSTVKE